MAHSETRRRLRAGIILSLVAAGAIVSLATVLQTSPGREWIYYRHDRGAIDGEYGLASVLLVKRHELLPGPSFIYRLYGPDQEQLVECNERGDRH